MFFEYQRNELAEKTNLNPCLIPPLEFLIMLVKHLANYDLLIKSFFL